MQEKGGELSRVSFGTSKSVFTFISIDHLLGNTLRQRRKVGDEVEVEHQAKIESLELVNEVGLL